VRNSHYILDCSESELGMSLYGFKDSFRLDNLSDLHYPKIDVLHYIKRTSPVRE